MRRAELCNLLFENVDFSQKEIKAVSYTHLDVYKRQMYLFDQELSQRVFDPNA